MIDGMADPAYARANTTGMLISLSVLVLLMLIWGFVVGIDKL